jgi:hypothetical protein
VKNVPYFLCVFMMFLVPSLALGHPHFQNTIKANLPGVAEVTIAYTTILANMSRAESGPPGSFIAPRGPKLTLSAEVLAGGVTIPAGEYTIGVIKNDADGWTMGLYKNAPARGAGYVLSDQARLQLFAERGERRAHAHRHYPRQRQVRRPGSPDPSFRNDVSRESTFFERVGGPLVGSCLKEDPSPSPFPPRGED